MNKILVTGGAGFIGSHLVEYLSKKNKVIVIDKLMHGNKIINRNKNIQLVKGDIRDFKLVDKLSKNCSTIFHLAAILGVDVVSDRNLETMECEFVGLKNVCNAAKNNKVKKIIYSSSSGVYGKLNYKLNVKEEVAVAPISAYSIAKRSAELYLKNFFIDYGISSIAVRLFNVYGPRQDERMAISRFIKQAKVGKNLTVYLPGNQTRDFTYIDDCVKVFDLINKKVKGFHILNSSKGEDLRIDILAKKILKSFNTKSKIKLVKVPKKLEEFQVFKRCGNSKKLFKLIKYKPKTTLEQGLKKTIDYFKNSNY